MSKYDSFRDRTNIEFNIAESGISNFIEKSLSSTEIYDVRNDTTIKAVLTRDHKEGNDEIILFTYVSEVLASNLVVGDYIEHKNKTYLVFMEFDHPLQEKYLKYKILECNVVIRFDDFVQYGAYFSSLRKFTDNAAKSYGDISISVENNKPVIVTANSTSLKVNTRFFAAAESFKILTLDRISNSGIVYLSIEQTPYNPTTDNLVTETAVTPDEPVVTLPTVSLRKGSTVSLATFNGYAVFIPMVKVLIRTMTTVTFEVPYGIGSLSVSLKDETDIVNTVIYEVL